MNPLLILLLASIIEFIAVLMLEHREHYANNEWALACGIVSTVLTVVIFVVQHYKPESLMKVLFSLPKFGEVTLEVLTAFFLFVWWCVGAGIITFQGPFGMTGNGYFACWAALFGAGAFFGATVPAVANAGADAKKKAQENTDLVVFLVASLVVICAAVQPGVTNVWEGVIAIVFASMGCAFCLIMLLAGDKVPAVPTQVATLLVAVCWIVEAFVCTFRRPFTVTTNGYFGSWFGLVAVMRLAVPQLPKQLSVAMNTASARDSQLAKSRLDSIVDVKVEDPKPPPQ